MKITLTLAAGLLVAGGSICLAQTDAQIQPAAGTMHNANAALGANIDTWIEGTVLTLDADGQKFTVRGVKLPFATVEAQMLADIAAKTKDLDVAQRDAKIAEIRASWASKLEKSKSEQVAASPSDFKFSLPDKANLMIMKQDGVSPNANPNSALAASGSMSSAPVVAPVSASGAASVSNDSKLNQSLSQAEANALHSLKDLKVGDKIKVGYDAGLISNTAYVVFEEGTAIRQ